MSEADDARRLALQARADRLADLPRGEGRFGLVQASGHGQRQEDRVLGDRWGVRARHVCNPDAARSGCFDVDGIDPDAWLKNETEASSIEHGTVDDAVDPRHDHVHPLHVVGDLTGPTGEHLMSGERLRPEGNAGEDSHRVTLPSRRSIVRAAGHD